MENIIPGDAVTFGDVRMAVEHSHGIDVFAPHHVPAYTKARAVFNSIRDRFINLKTMVKLFLWMTHQDLVMAQSHMTK